MRIAPRLGALIAVVFWGISFVATKGALREVTPITLIFSRFFLGTITLQLVAGPLASWRRGERGIETRRDEGRIWPQLVLMGFLGVFVHQMLQSYGLTMTTAVHAGWLIGLTPIWSALLSAFILHERLGGWKVAGLLGGFVGALLVITRGQFDARLLARILTDLLLRRRGAACLLRCPTISLLDIVVDYAFVAKSSSASHPGPSPPPRDERP